MKEFNKAIVAYLSSSVRDCIAGAGMAFDPAPRCYRDTFAKSDMKAFMADYEALLRDWYEVASRATHEIEHYRPEVSHSWKRRAAEAAKRRAGEREAV